MNFHELPTNVLDFLPESNGRLAGIDFFYIASEPSQATSHVDPITSATVR